MVVDPNFIEARTSVVTLPDGGSILVRPIVPDDKDDLADGLRRLSAGSRYARFFHDVERLTDRELTYLTEVDYRDHFAWVAAIPGDPPDGIGVARYVRSADDPTVAEAAVVVLDEYQNRGIATVLLGLLTESALANGISRFRADALRSNRVVIEALARAGAVFRDGDDEAITGFEVELPPPASTLRDSALQAALRAITLGGNTEAGGR